ncbi:hypothetical protein AB0883_29720 [Micromonospora sp. NPDC047812]|uniref:hypothetical protein n=1 Tax=Micromonospora sp. NPDC047812 TaxID=3155742 RepID=UPI003453451C
MDELLYGSFVAARCDLYQTRRFKPEKAQRWLQSIAILMAQPDGGGKPLSEIILHKWPDVLEARKVDRAGMWIMWMLLHMPFALYGIATNLGFDSGDDRQWSGWDQLSFAANWLMLIILSVTNAPWLGRIPARLSLKQLRTSRSVVIAGTGLVMAITMGVFAIKAVGLFFGMAMGVLIWANALMLALSRRIDSADALQPSDPVRYDALTSLISAVAIGLFYGFFVYEMLGLDAGLLLGGTAFFGWLCGSTVPRYLAGLYIGMTRHGVPFFFGHFLKWAHAAGLLRMSGLGYQFRHHDLQAYLEKG